VMVFSHVHYHVFTGECDWLALTTPALCGKTEFGDSKCEGTTDIGMIKIDIPENGGGIDWKANTVIL
jgi:hypothetical protein